MMGHEETCSPGSLTHVCKKNIFMHKKQLKIEKTMKKYRLRRSIQEKVLTSSDTMKRKLMQPREVKEKRTYCKNFHGYSWLSLSNCTKRVKYKAMTTGSRFLGKVSAATT
jgi:hypothetical protein